MVFRSCVRACVRNENVYAHDFPFLKHNFQSVIFRYHLLTNNCIHMVQRVCSKLCRDYGLALDIYQQVGDLVGDRGRALLGGRTLCARPSYISDKGRLKVVWGIAFSEMEGPQDPFLPGPKFGKYHELIYL